MRRHVDEILEELITQTRLACWSDCQFQLEHGCILKSVLLQDGKCLEFRAREKKEA